MSGWAFRGCCLAWTLALPLAAIAAAAVPIEAAFPPQAERTPVSLPVTLTFEADLRADIAAGRFDPQRDRVTVRGGVPPLSWQRGLALQPLGDGRYGLRVVFPRRPYGGQALAHKFRIERPGSSDAEGWEPDPNHAALLEGDRVVVARAFGAQACPAPTHIAGMLQALAPVPSRHVAARPVWVWLPPGYAQEPTRRYPVLYLHDGQNVFDAAAAGAEWQADETAQRLMEAGRIRPMIIVGVPSGPDRVHELTPTAMRLTPPRRGQPEPPLEGGGAPAYGRFLVEELKPLIDERFRTLPQAETTAVGGSSLGGLVSLWLALHHGQTFGTALVASPSVWWDDEFALRDVRAYAAVPRQAGALPRLWVDIGAEEGEEAVAGARALRAVLSASGWRPPRLAYTEDPEGRHDELSWASRFEAMLRFLDAGLPVTEPR